MNPQSIPSTPINHLQQGSVVAPTIASDQLKIIDALQKANNILVTTSMNPTVDELASTIGITLLLNKMDKHATAVFSGAIPQTIEFLKPEDTIEKNTDSLRDFIISLDKEKADKLKYKVEDNVVKVFITPYRTSITEADLEFTQGDFNVDVVLALGVREQGQLDQAITAHGRILHDATVVTICVGTQPSTLGAVNLTEVSSSSLGETLASFSENLKPGIFDAQIATAYLTGIVSETERFRNPKTSPTVMSLAAKLMTYGANQQLIAAELEKPEEIAIEEPEQEPEQEPVAQERDDKEQPPTALVKESTEDGTITVVHNDSPAKSPMISEQPSEIAIDPTQIEIDNQGNLQNASDLKREAEEAYAQTRIVQEEDKPSDESLALSNRHKVIEPPGNEQDETGTTKNEETTSMPFAGQPMMPPAFNSAMIDEETDAPDAFLGINGSDNTVEGHDIDTTQTDITTNSTEPTVSASEKEQADLVERPIVPMSQEPSEQTQAIIGIDQAQANLQQVIASTPYDTDRPQPRADVAANILTEIRQPDVTQIPLDTTPPPSVLPALPVAQDSAPVAQDLLTPPPVPPVSLPVIPTEQMSPLSTMSPPPVPPPITAPQVSGRHLLQ